MTITRSLPFSSYLRLPSVHFSALKHMAVSPLHYRRACDGEGADTDALRVGRAVHALTLTPEVADVVTWDGHRRGKAWAEFAYEHAGRTILTESETVAANAMRHSILRHPIARRLLSAGDPEVTVEWTDTETGLACRARVDWLGPWDHFVELKTCRASHPDSFQSSFARYRYHAQLAFYLDGLRAACEAEGVDPDPSTQPYVIAVEKSAPHDVCVYAIPDDAIEAGRRLVRTWLRRVAECTASGKWPGAGGDGVVTLALPDWAATEGLPDVNMGGVENAEDDDGQDV